MKSKTHIIVLHMKEIIYTAIFVIFAVVLILLLAFMFGGKKKEESAVNTWADPSQDNISTSSGYIPGVYTSSIILGDNAVDIAVTVDSGHINGVSLVNLEESVATMYPLLGTCMDDISAQLSNGVSLDNITSDSSNQYTYQILTAAIRSALEKASMSADAIEQ